MRQYRDGAVFVRARHRRGRRRRVQRGVDLPGDPAAARGDPAARRVGPARPRMTGPHPRGGRHPGRRRARSCSALPAGALVLVACSGGADSLALAAAAAFEAPRAGLRAGALVVDHALQAGSGDVAAPRGRDLPRPGPRPRPRPAGDVRAAGEGPEAAARTARYDALRPPRRLGAAGAARAHPRRPGRAGPARPRPRLRRPVPGRYAAPPRRVRAPAAGPPAGHHRAGLRRRGPRPVAGPAQRGPGLPPGPRPAAAGRARARPRPGRRTRPRPLGGPAARGRGPHRRARGGGPAHAGRRAARRRGAGGAARGRSGRGSGGCWPWRPGCRPARCSPCTSTRSTRWSAGAGAGRARSTCRVACRAGARVARCGSPPRVRFNRAVHGARGPPQPHVRRSRGRRPHGSRPRACAHHRGGDPRQAGRARRPDLEGLRGQGPAARRHPQGRGHGHGRPDARAARHGADGLDGDLLLRLGHQVLRRGPASSRTSTPTSPASTS